MFDDVRVLNETRRRWNGDLQGITEYLVDLSATVFASPEYSGLCLSASGA
jgi:hypothetical protein